MPTITAVQWITDDAFAGNVALALPAPPTPGNLLVYAHGERVAGGSLVAGFTSVDPGSSPLTVAYKVSDGTEQNISVGTNAFEHKSALYVEFAVSGGVWIEVEGFTSASNTGTTITAPGYSPGTYPMLVVQAVGLDSNSAGDLDFTSYADLDGALNRTTGLIGWAVVESPDTQPTVGVAWTNNRTALAFAVGLSVVPAGGWHVGAVAF